jgi:hypothetical protein
VTIESSALAFALLALAARPPVAAEAAAAAAAGTARTAVPTSEASLLTLAALDHIAVGIGARRSRPEVAFVIIKVTLLINRYNTNKLANYF